VQPQCNKYNNYKCRAKSDGSGRFMLEVNLDNESYISGDDFVINIREYSD